MKPSAEAAEALASRGHVIPVMFPPGTNLEGTKARPEVWSDRAGFEKAAATFVAEAQKPADMAAWRGPTTKRASARRHTATTRSCGACHRGHRVRTN